MQLDRNTNYTLIFPSKEKNLQTNPQKTTPFACRLNACMHACMHAMCGVTYHGTLVVINTKMPHAYFAMFIMWMSPAPGSDSLNLRIHPSGSQAKTAEMPIHPRGNHLSKLQRCLDTPAWSNKPGKHFLRATAYAPIIVKRSSKRVYTYIYTHRK